MSLTKCNSSSFSLDYGQKIRELGEKWRNDPKNPVNAPLFLSFVNKWDSYIKTWASDPSIPLLIRKKDNDLGTINTHKSGRKLVPVDNTPAQWVFTCTCNGISPPINVITGLDSGNIPIAMVLPKPKPGIQAYRGKLQNNPNTQTLDWYLAHKINVGLNKKMLDCTLNELEDHFIKLMSPLNMFVVPKDKAMRGLAELIDFIEQQ